MTLTLAPRVRCASCKRAMVKTATVTGDGRAVYTCPRCHRLLAAGLKHADELFEPLGDRRRASDAGTWR